MSKNEMATQKAELRTLLEGPAFQEQIAKALPRHCAPERFTRIALTALNRTPKLLQCTQPSLFQCLLDLSAVGLEPDGRHAHLIPYGKDCTLVIDYKGLLAIARRNGVTAEAKVVRANDAFEVQEDDGHGRTALKHAVDYSAARGDLVCVYSRASWVEDGERVTSYEIMTRDEIDAIRGRSKAGNSGPWVTDYDEMARKTVLRRHSKRWPMDAEQALAMDKDHDAPDFTSNRFTAAKPVFAEAMFEKPDLEDPADEAELSREGLAPEQPETAEATA